MEPDSGFGRIGDLFFELLELDAAGREARLAEPDVSTEVREQVTALLDHHDAGDDPLPDNPMASLARDVADATSAAREVPAFDVPGYTIEGVLGRGGMGVVYRARQHRPDRLVALKVVRSAGFGDLVRRFEYEAEILGRLAHAGIAQIYEVGTFTDHDLELPYFAMELVEGEPLGAFIARTSPKLEERLLIVARIGEAVEHAHQRGVVHRDLKPDNILVTADGDPKILDFGIAKATGQDVNASTILTGTGQIVGTIPYMSPEQVRGDSRAIDTRSDVYSLGVILYEVLSGALPLEVRQLSIVEAVRVICEDEPSSLTRFDSGLRGDVDIVVRKALAKEPERRYASAGALAADLHHILRSEPIEARPTSAIYAIRKFTRRHRVLVSAAAAIFVALVVTIVVIVKNAAKTRTELARTAVERDNARFSAFLANMGSAGRELRAGRFTEARLLLDEIPREFRDWEWDHQRALLEPYVTRFGERVKGWCEFTPDGRIAAVRLEDGAVEVWDVVEEKLVRAWPDARAETPKGAISPDGRFVATLEAGGGIVVRDVATGAVRHRIPPASSPIKVVQFDATSSAWIAFHRDLTIRRHRLEDGTPLSVESFLGSRGHLGMAVLGLDDVDGDEVDDYAVSEPLAEGEEPGAGRVRIHSGRTGAVLRTLRGRRRADGFGYAMAAVGDQDGDGRADLAVGAPFDDEAGLDAGCVTVISSVTGELLRRLDGPEPDAMFGTSIAAAGDHDGDGRVDIVTGSADATQGWRIYSGRTGEVLRSSALEKKRRRELFWGATVQGSSLVIGTGLGAGRATVVRHDADGETVLWDGRGRVLVTALDDVDGDGVADLAIATGGAEDAVALISGSDGTKIETEQALPSLRAEIAAGDDLDADGLGDLVIFPQYAGRADEGVMKAAGVYSVKTGRKLMGFEEVASRPGDGALSVIGDVDGDGVRDILTGEPGRDDGHGLVTLRSGASGRVLRRHAARTRAPESEQWAKCLLNSMGKRGVLTREARTGFLGVHTGHSWFVRGPGPDDPLHHGWQPGDGARVDAARRRFVSRGDGSELIIVDLDDPAATRRFSRGGDLYTMYAVDVRGRLGVSLEGHLDVYDTDFTSPRRIPAPYATGGVLPLGDGADVAIVGDSVTVVDTRRGTSGIVLPHDSYVYDAVFSPDGSLVATVSWDGFLRLWDAHLGGELARYRLRQKEWHAAAFSRDGERVIVWHHWSWKANYSEWDLAGRHLFPRVKGREVGAPEVVHAYALERRVAADRMAAGIGEGIRRHGGRSEAFLTPDRSMLLSPDRDLVRIRDGRTGALRRTLDGHDGRLFCLALSPDGRRIAGGGDATHLHLWDTDSGRVVARLEGHTDYIYRVRFSPDGTQIVTASGDGTARIRDRLSVAERHRRARGDAARRARFEPLVREALATTKTRREAAEKIRARPDLSPGERRDALHLLIRQP